jgi:exodeoxyribonuclease VII small subunit
MMTNMTGSETYETLYQQLQQVVADLEAGERPLEELLRLYEQGVQLASACQRMLDQAELRVQHLQVVQTTGELPLE